MADPVEQFIAELRGLGKSDQEISALLEDLAKNPPGEPDKAAFRPPELRGTNPRARLRRGDELDQPEPSPRGVEMGVDPRAAALRQSFRGAANAVAGSPAAAKFLLGEMMGRQLGIREPVKAALSAFPSESAEDLRAAPGFQGGTELATSFLPGAMYSRATALPGKLLGPGKTILGKAARGAVGGAAGAALGEGGKALLSGKPEEAPERALTGVQVGGSLGGALGAVGGGAGALSQWVRDPRTKTGQIIKTIEEAGGRIRFGRKPTAPGGLVSKAQQLSEGEQGIHEAASKGGRRMLGESQRALWNTRREFERSEDAILSRHDSDVDTSQLVDDLEQKIGEMSTTRRVLTEGGQVVNQAQESFDPAAGELAKIRDALLDQVEFQGPAGSVLVPTPGRRSLREVVKLRRRLDNLGKEGTIAGKDEAPFRQMSDAFRQHIGDPAVGGSEELGQLYSRYHTALSQLESFNDKLLGAREADISSVGGHSMAQGEDAIDALGGTLPAGAYNPRVPPEPTQLHLARAENRLASQGKWGAAGGVSRQEALDQIAADNPQFREDIELPRVARALADTEFASSTAAWAPNPAWSTNSFLMNLGRSNRNAAAIRLIDPATRAAERASAETGLAGYRGTLIGDIYDELHRKQEERAALAHSLMEMRLQQQPPGP